MHKNVRVVRKSCRQVHQLKYRKVSSVETFLVYMYLLIGCVGLKGIDQFRYIKIQPKTIDLNTRLWVLGNNYRVCGVYSPEPRAEVYCLRLNFNISKLVYWTMPNERSW